MHDMDDKIAAVLDEYHDLIRQQRERPPETLDERLLAVGPETGRLINILARSLSRPTILELGTSYGYSGIWLAHAAREAGGRLISMELQEYKSAFARRMVEKAGLAAHVTFRVGDAVRMIGELEAGIDFVLVDLWKDIYTPCLEAFYPRLNPGAIMVADNMIYPGDAGVKRYGQTIRRKRGMTSILVPVGSGLEISRYEP